MKLNFDFLRRNRDKDTVTKTAPTFAPTNMGGWDILNGMLPGSNYDYVKAAGNIYQNSVISGLLNFTSRNFTDAKLGINEAIFNQGKTENIPLNHKLLELIEWPNDYYDSNVLWYATLLSYYTNGNAYWLKDENPATGEPTRLWYLPHFCMEAISENPKMFLEKYKYTIPNTGQHVFFKPNEIVHFKWGMDPYNMRYGLSPVNAILREIATDNEITVYCSAILRNMGVSGGIFSPKENQRAGPSEEQKRHFKEMANKVLTGEGRGQFLLMPFAMDIQKLGVSPEDMALDKMDGRQVTRICSAWGVDPMVIGLNSPTGKVHANYKEALRSAYVSSLLPTQKEIANQLTKTFFGNQSGRPSKTYFIFDTTNVKALAEDTTDRWSRSTLGYQRGVISRGEAKVELGLVPKPEEFDIYMTDFIKQDEKSPEEGKGSNKEFNKSILGEDESDETPIASFEWETPN